MPAAGTSKEAGPTQAQIDSDNADAGRIAAVQALAKSDEKIDKATLERKADMIVNRAANVILKGGSLFQPTNIKEATDMAKAWNQIAASQTNRRKGELEADQEVVDDVDLTAEAAVALEGTLEAFKARLRVVAS